MKKRLLIFVPAYNVEDSILNVLNNIPIKRLDTFETEILAINDCSNDETLKNSEVLKKTLEHLEIINKDLISIFKKNNIEPIDSINKKLDPNFHQAMLEVENDQKEPGTIIQEIQKGFMMKDRLLRPALVGVTKKFEKNKNDAKKDEKNEQNQEKSIKK